MNLSRIGTIIKLAAAIVLAGIGHSFVAFQRDVYPLDGYAYYLAAGFFFAWALRSMRAAPDFDWSALREPLLRMAQEARRLLSMLIGAQPGLALPVGLIALNALSAILALLFSSWIAFVGWGLSAIWLAVAVWPRQTPPPAEDFAASPDALVEPEEPAGRVARWGLFAAGGLLIVLGQVIMGLQKTPDAIGVLGDVGDEIARLLLLSLPGDAGPAVLGLILMFLGAIAFAFATRRVALDDRPPLSVEVRSQSRAGWDGRWLAAAAIGLLLWLLVVQSAASGGTGLGPVALWLAALALLGATWRRIDLDRGVRLALSLDRREAFRLLLAVGAALAVWLIQLDRLPASIWPDEGAYWTFARDMVTGQSPINLFGLGTYSFPAGGSVYQSIWIGLFGQTIWSWRWGSVLAVIGSMLPLYFLARDSLGRRVAFVALAFFASSPLLLAYGRIGYLYALAILPVVLSAWLALEAIRRDSRFYAFLCGLAGGISFMLYPSARFGIVLSLLIGVGFALGRLARGRSMLRLGLSFGAAAILAAGLPLAYGLIREPDAFADKLFESSMANTLYAEQVFGRDELLARASFRSTRDNQLFYEPSLYARLALKGWAQTWIGLHQSGLATEHYVVGPLAGPLGLLYVLGLAWGLARWRRPGYFVWPMWLFAGTLLLSAIETFPPHVPDLLPIVPALAVLAALGLVGLVEALKTAWPSVSTRLEIGGLAIVTVGIALLGLQAYFGEMPQRYKPNLEMTMFWSTLDMPRGATLVFVRDESYSAEFMPWGLENFDTGVNWWNVDAAGASQTDFLALCSAGCRIFYTPASAGVEPQLRAALGAGTVTPYTDESGAVIGYAYAP